MNKRFFAFLIILSSSSFLTFCSDNLRRYSKKRNTIEKYEHLNDTTLRISGVAKNNRYGYSEDRPVMLGILDVHIAADNILKFLNALEGPNGESIVFKRLKPCCPFKTKNFTYSIPYFNINYDHKRGMLEKYNIEYVDSLGVNHSSILFFNLYDETNEVLAPAGFRYKVR